MKELKINTLLSYFVKIVNFVGKFFCKIQIGLMAVSMMRWKRHDLPIINPI